MNKSRFEYWDLQSNNWLKLHNYAMGRFCGKRKKNSISDTLKFPFSDSKKKDRKAKREKYKRRFCYYGE